MLPNIECDTAVQNNTFADYASDYGILLRSFGLEYREAEYYWQVGEITRTQGWIIHLSVVLSQIQDLLNQTVPFLSKEGVAFKIVTNEPTGEDLLNGNLGLAQIGKIVSIYPETDTVALGLAKKLIKLTLSYRGPIVPTDIRLGNIVFARYGSFNPIVKLNGNGNKEKYIYDTEGQLIKDTYAMPFQLPKGVHWPFKGLADPILPEPPKLLNHVYKLMDILKPDPRGNVFKGLYVKKLLQVKSCVIKQGFSNMSSDIVGRDIQDRLIWQNELYKELSDTIPMPIVYDLLKEEASTVLVMEFIKGSSLFDKLTEINPLSTCWIDLPLVKSSQLLGYTIEIASIIDRMHKRGYVHRDIVPVNFLINKNNRITLIDIELAYSLKRNIPDPPFRLGTPGFMSPEQEQTKRPTTYEDIYGLGATLLYIFTGILPIKFNTKDTNGLIESLYFFIGNNELAEIIAYSLHPDAKQRPAISTILSSLNKCHHQLPTISKPLKYCSRQDLDQYKLKEIISSALVGLIKPPIVILDNLWYSKHITIENYTAPKNKQYAKIPGVSEGICGVLYALARFHRAGINIDACMNQFSKGWQFIHDNYLNRLSELPPGLYKGAAGLAMALAEGMRNGLLEENEINKEKIQKCLSLSNESIDLANGITGQGVALLQCKDFLKKEVFQVLLDKIIGELLNRLQKDGSWINSTTIKKRKNTPMNIGHDDTGTIWFLLEYILLYPNMEIKKVLIKTLRQRLSSKSYMKFFYDLVASNESYQLGDGGKGLIIMLIKAYEVLRDDSYKKMVEKALLMYPHRIIHNNLTQENGLAAIEEVYLEAWQVFKNDEWKRRADWIANVFIHSFLRTEVGCGHWVMEQNNPPTADFLTGNSGIIHSLVRCLDPEKIGYRLLN